MVCGIIPSCALTQSIPGNLHAAKDIEAQQYVLHDGNDR